jgi:hypothetical protein
MQIRKISLLLGVSAAMGLAACGSCPEKKEAPSGGGGGAPNAQLGSPGQGVADATPGPHNAQTDATKKNDEKKKENFVEENNASEPTLLTLVRPTGKTPMKDMTTVLKARIRDGAVVGFIQLQDGKKTEIPLEAILRDKSFDLARDAAGESIMSLSSKDGAKVKGNKIEAKDTLNLSLNYASALKVGKIYEKASMELQLVNAEGKWKLLDEKKQLTSSVNFEIKDDAEIPIKSTGKTAKIYSFGIKRSQSVLPVIVLGEGNRTTASAH